MGTLRLCAKKRFLENFDVQCDSLKVNIIAPSPKNTILTCMID